MTFDVFDVDSEAMGGAATRKQVMINFTGEKDGLSMKLILFIPNDAPKAGAGISIDLQSRPGEHRPDAQDQDALLARRADC